jgi:hypothetical protein
MTFNPFLSNSPETPKLDLMSTLPTPLVQNQSFHPKVTRVSTHSNYSLQFPQKSSFVQNNCSTLNNTSRPTFVSSSFHVKHHNKPQQKDSISSQQRELKRAQSYVHNDNQSFNNKKMEPNLVRTLSDPFSGEHKLISQPSSQNHLLFSTDGNLSMISSPNRQSISNTNCFTSSVLNDSRSFNMLSPNNLIIMPLGSISNETRVNIYSNGKGPKPKQDLTSTKANILTGRVNLGVVHENIPEKKCFTSSRQGISGNSLTELLAGLRPPDQQQSLLNKKIHGKPLIPPNLFLNPRPKIEFVKKIPGFKSNQNGGQRNKLAKSQPKLRQMRSNVSCSNVQSKKLKQPKKSCIRYNNVYKVPGSKPNPLYYSLKKEFKENKLLGLNFQNNFKKKKSKIVCIFYSGSGSLIIRLCLSE